MRKVSGRGLPPDAREMGGDAVREMTGDDDPVSRRDEEMNEDEVGGPYQLTDANGASASVGDDDYLTPLVAPTYEP
ncbi:MAG: hypothetical protein AB7S26_38825 [Sandaracinaceae bacterium]